MGRHNNAQNLSLRILFFFFPTMRFFFFKIIILERENRMKVTEVNNPCCQASGSRISLLRGISPTVSVLSVNINIKHLLLPRQVLYSERTKPSLGEQPIQVGELKLPNTATVSALHLYLGGAWSLPREAAAGSPGWSSSSCLCGDCGSQPLDSALHHGLLPSTTAM